MTIYDPLYGRFCLPPFLQRFMETSEVLRLSQVRLLNTVSPSMAALGEVRRFSHTLGVLFLSLRSRLPEFSTGERRALGASVLAHDIGTPAFGHLFEYHLKERTNWDHERIIHSILWGHHAPENRAHQIFARRVIEFGTALRASRIPAELVEAIIAGKHPMSLLLFGSMDLDNLDNVARMAWALGLSNAADFASDLASGLSVTRDGRVWLSAERHEARLHEWARLRRTVYDAIVFDPPTIAAQAVLSEAIGKAMESGILTEDDWSLTDEALLDVLLNHDETKAMISREFLGRLPSLAFAVQLDGTLKDLGFKNRSEAKSLVERVLRRQFPKERVLGYSFVDKGTFEKRLQLWDPDTGQKWEEGSESRTTVLYGFVRSVWSPSHDRCMRAVQALTRRLGIHSDRIKRVEACQSPEQAGLAEHDTKEAEFARLL